MTGYPLKLFKNRYGFSGRPEASVLNKLPSKPLHPHLETSFQRCGSETTYSNADSLKSPADVTQADYIFDAVLDDRSPVSSTDEEKSECSVYCCNRLLITPIPRRHTLFSPPKSMFNGVPKHVRHGVGESKPITKLLPWKRGYVAKSSSASHSSIKVQSPYISKRALSKLSPALINSGQVAGSPWRKPTSHRLSKCTPPSVIDMKIVPSSTSDSDSLPLVISPACKFVPIGYESDDDCTFSSGDYEMFTKTKFDVDSRDKYSSERDQLLESKSAVTSNRSYPKSSETKLIQSKLNSTSRAVNEGINIGNAEDDLTPFEMDQKAETNNLTENGIEACTPFEADQILLQRESSSFFDPSEEFTIMSFCESEAAEPQNIDNDVGRKDQKQIHFNDWWYIWDQVASVITCGTV
ncbi:hypothetical protein HJC23_013411 [Cyclotella cryptica]|uniref:Uncharacterized protein n=1 Tax=Cyclotella cryptica TaxID=29204 RepID=A0ABD3PWH8_9STRA|eukprot:CCRYP_010970-RA/>CCRYP_010970-RA protein AED:0.11 eAED:0.11 QI:0/-1/0/1/-1/1/1/0/408